MTVRQVSSLLPHEETIGEQVDQVALDIERSGVQRDPVIVDSDRGVVLDGMHRIAAFRKLGFQEVVCSPVDYSSSSIGLHRWARAYAGEAAKFIEVARSAGFWSSKSVTKALSSLDRREHPALVMTGGECLVPREGATLAEGLSMVRRLDEASSTSGWRRSFVPEDEIDAPLNDGAMVLLLQRLGKQDVVRAAVSGQLFPCKTSLHTIERRPVGVNFPVAELGGGAESALRARLSKARRRLLPANSVYEGRRYKESLMVLDFR
ncbi:MAG: hypothetical protein HY296_03215 [Thaumarchaeota archaeon]|nr:hypothetical protein [Nitrososphaerota archaeon]